MWKYASDTGKSSIDELEPAEFLDCLHLVSDFLRKHPAQITKTNLEAFRGPQNVEDQREAERVNYLGDAAVYKYYDKRMFLCELRSIAGNLSPETATERQYEEALGNTSRAISDSWAKRSVVDEYRGPQSFVHRFCSDRIHYTIDTEFKLIT